MSKDFKKPNYYRELHKRLGCFGCLYANEKMLGQGACCTLPSYRHTDENGQCLARLEKKNNESDR